MKTMMMITMMLKFRLLIVLIFTYMEMAERMIVRYTCGVTLKDRRSHEELRGMKTCAVCVTEA